MKTIIITGANSGLGFETAKKIAKHGDCKIILACRSMEKAERAKVAIVGETGNQNVVTMPLDTSSLRSVRSFAQEILSQGETIGCTDQQCRNLSHAQWDHGGRF